MPAAGRSMPTIDALLGQYADRAKGDRRAWRGDDAGQESSSGWNSGSSCRTDFASVEFNHKLSQQILPFGARVAATERSKENVVTMHVVNDGVIIRTIVVCHAPVSARRPGKEGGKTRRKKSRNGKAQSTLKGATPSARNSNRRNPQRNRAPGSWTRSSRSASGAASSFNRARSTAA